MYVCVCHAINETRVREAVAQGRTSVRALREHFDFGECCGKCNACMRELINEAQADDCACADRSCQHYPAELAAELSA